MPGKSNNYLISHANDWHYNSMTVSCYNVVMDFGKSNYSMLEKQPTVNIDLNYLALNISRPNL